jgi:hypothetical protein
MAGSDRDIVDRSGSRIEDPDGSEIFAIVDKFGKKERTDPYTVGEPMAQGASSVPTYPPVHPMAQT